MAIYIDADTLYVNVKADCNPYGKPTINFDDGCKVLDMIRRTPTADVTPVIHAHWTYEIDDLFPVDSMMICSNCGEYERLEANDNYCGNCGAKMDEVTE